MNIFISILRFYQKISAMAIYFGSVIVRDAKNVRNAIVSCKDDEFNESRKTVDAIVSTLDNLTKLVIQGAKVSPCVHDCCDHPECCSQDVYIKESIGICTARMANMTSHVMELEGKTWRTFSFRVVAVFRALLNLTELNEQDCKALEDSLWDLQSLE